MKRALEEIGFDLEEVLSLDKCFDPQMFQDLPSRIYAPFFERNYLEICTDVILFGKLGGEAQEKD